MRRLFLAVTLCLLSARGIDSFSSFDSFEESLPSPLRIKSRDVVLPPTFQQCWVTVTGYSSETEQTDDTPLITSSNSQVRWGTLATNWLPFGAEVRMPEYFGEESFLVEDRMHMRNWHKVDIWFPDATDAWKWGRKRVLVEIRLDSIDSDFYCPPQDPVGIPDNIILWHGRRQITGAQATNMVATSTD